MIIGLNVLVMFCVILIAFVVADQMALLRDVRRGWRPTELEFEANAAVFSKLSCLAGVLNVVRTILWLFWVYRANQNARAISGEELKFTPGWAVGYYFVPFWNLIRPYQSMTEIWEYTRKGSSAVVDWWWTAVILVCIFNMVSIFSSFGARRIDDLLSALAMAIVMTVPNLLLLSLTSYLVWKLTQLQEAVVRNSRYPSPASPTDPAE